MIVDKGSVYLVRAVSGTGLVKIGYTRGPVQIRLKALQVGSPVKLEIIHHYPATPEIEHILHRHFKDFRSHGEWFDFDQTNEGVIEQVTAEVTRLRSIMPGVPAQYEICDRAIDRYLCLKLPECGDWKHDHGPHRRTNQTDICWGNGSLRNKAHWLREPLATVTSNGTTVIDRHGS